MGEAASNKRKGRLGPELCHPCGDVFATTADSGWAPMLRRPNEALIPDTQLAKVVLREQAPLELSRTKSN
jgi:hypothetical protein